MIDYDSNGAKKNAKSTSLKAKINGCYIMSCQQRLAALFKLLQLPIARGLTTRKGVDV